MEQKLTHYQTLMLQDVVEIGGDLLLLPAQQPSPYEEVRALRAGQTIAIGGSLLVEAVERYYPLMDSYNTYRFRYGKEPPWIMEKPAVVRTRLRLDFALTQEDPLAILGVYPHTGLSYMVRNGGLCEDLARACNLFRLQGVKQLGYLQAPFFQDQLYPQPVGEHNRYVHSLDVMTIATIIGRNLGLAEVPFNTLRMAAFTHDMGTPAGGDSIKLIDPVPLDEDLNYPALLARHDWRHIHQKYQIDEPLLYETILNRGLLGQILDIADTCAYVARDLHACDPYIHFGRDHLDQHGLHTLLELVNRFPNVCGIWDAVEVRNGQMVITDPARLYAFLKVRVLLFRELYYHPNARFGEYLVSRVLAKALYQTGKLTREQLLTMVDYQLDAVLDREFGKGRGWQSQQLVGDIASSGGAKRKTFHTRQEAQVFLDELHAAGNPFALLEDNSRGIKLKTHFNVLVDGDIKPFAAAFPGDDDELREMATLYPSVHVYYLTRPPNIPPEKLAALAAAFTEPAPQGP